MIGGPREGFYPKPPWSFLAQAILTAFWRVGAATSQSVAEACLLPIGLARCFECQFADQHLTRELRGRGASSKFADERVDGSKSRTQLF